MTRKPTYANLMATADRALRSAQTLLDDGDTNGAANRAYYTMHDAARAALTTSGVHDTTLT